MENVKPELIEKAKKAKTSEELRAFAGENGMELTEEQANAYYAQFHPTSGEMADEELENVAGGGCHSGDGRLVLPSATIVKIGFVLAATSIPEWNILATTQ